MTSKFESLVGETLTEITGARPESDEIVFRTLSGKAFRMHHIPDCCETVAVSEVIGDVADLIGSPVLLAEEVKSENSVDPKPIGYDESWAWTWTWTWTFYKLSTLKGSVTIRWLGKSKGYYSESVNFTELKRSPRR
jgi:hypothetical protein